MIRFGQRFAAMVAAVLLLSGVAAAPAIAQQPSWSHRDQRVCSQPGADQARCASIARTIYRNGRPFQARTKAELAAAAAAAGVGYFHGADLRTAYGIAVDQIGDPSKVIAIVDAYDDPNAFTNLTRFRTDQGFTEIQSCTLSQLTGLASSAGSPCFAKVNQTGGTSLPRRNNGWANEIDLDLQAASVICPMCSILLLEARSASIGNLGTAVTTASNTPHVVAISNSYGVSGDYPQSVAPAWNTAAAGGIAVMASTGDGGYGPEFPASSTNVIAVGGTTVAVDGSGVRSSETAWSGTGSGCSVYNTAPPWQTITPDPCAGNKALADLSADADPSSGLAVYTTYNGTTGYWIFGGTSLSSPLMAALYAMQGGYDGSTLAGQYAWASGTPYFDVTSGSNGSCSPSVLCNAGDGWDGPTGLGSISVAPSAPPTLTTITVSPPSVSLQTNGTQSFTATGYDQYGDSISTGQITWSVDPAGVGSIDSFGSYSAGTTAGSATVRATSGSVSGTAQVTVTEPTAGDFLIAVTPTSQSVKRGGSVTYTVTITPLNGFAGSVTLSLASTPSRSTATFSPNPTTGTSTLTIDTSRRTSRSTYDLTITGVSGSLSHSATASLTVTK